MSLENEQAYVDTMRECLIDYIGKSKASQSRVAKEIGVSKTTLSLFLNGSYTGNNLDLAKSIEQYIRMGTVRQTTAKVPEICLTVRNTVKIKDIVQSAHIQNVIALIYGPAGCSKTTTLQHYTKTTNGVIYVEADVTTNSPRCVLKLLLAAMGEEPKGSTADMMQLIISKLSDTNRLLIIDEAQHLTGKSFDAVRAINDKAHIGIVYAGNKSIIKRMYGKEGEMLDHLLSRSFYQCELHNNYSQEDIAGIYSNENLNKECIRYLYQLSRRKGGLRIMVNQCRIAQNIALAMGEEFSVEHLKEAAVKMGIGGTI